jgi:integrase
MKRKKATRHERALRRLPVGPLKATLVKPSTLQLYHHSLKVFYLWLAFHRILWPATLDDLDIHVSSFGEAAWEEGETRALFANLISGIRYFEESLKNSLFASKRLLTAWDRNEWTVRSFPLTFPMVKALAGVAVSRGWLDVAVALLVGFAGLLRVLELLSVRRCDIKGGLSATAVVIELPNTKTSSRKSVRERAIIEEPLAALLLLLLADELAPDQFVFRGLSPKILRSRLPVLAAKLGLQDLFITPHSLRRGAATHYFRETGSFDFVADRGRWESIRTCRKYIDAAIAELGEYLPTGQDKLRHFEKILSKFVS